jgi:hypothetical protein
MKNTESKGDAQASGLTLERYAREKGFSVDFLARLGVAQIHIGGVPTLKIPYLDEEMEEIAVRFRHSTNKDERRFSWRKKTKPCLYGLWRLEKARKAGHISIVEGESDCHTLWHHNVPAIGVPGANNWKEAWSKHLEGIDKIFVVAEPDKGGDTMLAWVRKSAIHERVSIVTLDGAKDPSALYLKNPARFLKRWNKAVAASRPLHNIATAEKAAEAKAAWEECKELAAKDNILDEFADALKQRGAAGISRIAKIIFLALVSRFLSRIVSIGLKGPSSGGKSFAAGGVLAFFPNDAFHLLTGTSEKSIVYSEEPLSHRFIVLYEAHALDNEWAAYFIRSLLSEGHLIYETVEKTPEGLRARRIERAGPTGLLTTTTAVSLHPENETRFLSLAISDSPAQTRRIIAAEARKFSGETGVLDDEGEVLRPWHALQRWLKSAEHRVVVPFASVVGSLIPPVAVRLRRDFPTVMSLVQAHALLHQASRERDSEGRIIAILEEDYGTVRDLVKQFIAEGVEQSVPKTTRETVDAVSKAIRGKLNVAPGGATIREIAETLGIDRSAAQRRVREGIARGFLTTPEETKQGKITRIALGDELPEDATLLPNIKRVQEQLNEIANDETDRSERDE